MITFVVFNGVDVAVDFLHGSTDSFPGWAWLGVVVVGLGRIALFRDIAGSFKPSTPYSNAATNPQVVTYAKQVLRRLEPVFPGITAQWNGKASLSTPFLDPNLKLAYSYWRVGQYTSFSGYEGVAQGNIHFAGEHCSQDFQGYMEGGASEGQRAAAEVLAAL